MVKVSLRAFGKLVIGALLGRRAFALAVLPVCAGCLGVGVFVAWLMGALR